MKPVRRLVLGLGVFAITACQQASSGANYSASGTLTPVVSATAPALSAGTAVRPATASNAAEPAAASNNRRRTAILLVAVAALVIAAVIISGLEGSEEIY